MRIRQASKIRGDQDGAIYGNELFRFDTGGNCAVYDLRKIINGGTEEATPLSEFRLGGADVIVPHSNAVCFGCDFYREGDTYPLLYSNVYNNYADNEDKLIGVCAVYRILRSGDVFSADLVQLIEIGFTEDVSLWKATAEKHGARPYGNFVVNTETREYYAFVMRNEELGTRFFRFDLPKPTDGELDGRFGVKRVVLTADRIKETFDLGYFRYVQGAVLYGGRIYSTEGFHKDKVNRPAIRVIDLADKSETYVDIMELGYVTEPEFIDFYEGECYYSDAGGNLYVLEF